MSPESPNPSQRENRSALEARRMELQADISTHALGSAQAQLGKTRVFVTCSAAELKPGEAPVDLAEELGLSILPLPFSTGAHSRSAEEIAAEKVELEYISQLVLQALREAFLTPVRSLKRVRLEVALIASDGGVASATLAASWLALYQALRQLAAAQTLDSNVQLARVAAVSFGLLNNQAVIDLTPSEYVGTTFRGLAILNSREEILTFQAQKLSQGLPLSGLEQILPAIRGAVQQIFAEQQRAAGGE